MNKGLAAAARKRAEMRDRGEKVKIRNPIEIALQNPISLRSAVNAKCYECVGGEIDNQPENWRAEIKYCTSKICPLLKLRPYQEQSE